MNVNLYKRDSTKKDIVYCMVDNSFEFSPRARQIIKNIADYTLSNLYIKNIDVLQGDDENLLLNQALEHGYKHAVVFNMATEFIGGTGFFDCIERLVAEDYFIAGHVLDRKDAFYELHHQCYVINLEKYNDLGQPEIGEQCLGFVHKQCLPWRSAENLHDDYTPIWVSGGDDTRFYNHKCHGWNILGIAFDQDLKVIVFDEEIRQFKRHHYPESSMDFNKALQWLHFRQNYCSSEFVHTMNTDAEHAVEVSSIKQLVIPASGTMYTDLISDDATVIMYDYNQNSLDYWYENSPETYQFKKVDLLGPDFELESFFDITIKDTFINLTNIFCYEGTCSFADIEYRVYKENQLLEKLQSQCPDAYINFTNRAAMGIVGELKLFGKAKDFQLTDLKKATKPTYWFLSRL